MSVLEVHSDELYDEFLYNIREVLRVVYSHGIETQTGLAKELKTIKGCRFTGGRLSTWLDIKNQRELQRTTKDNALALHKVAKKYFQQAYAVDRKLDLLAPEEVFREMGGRIEERIIAPAHVEYPESIHKPLSTVDIMKKMDKLRAEIAEKKNKLDDLSKILFEETREYLGINIVDNTVPLDRNHKLAKLIQQHWEVLADIEKTVQEIKVSSGENLLREAQEILEKFS